MDLRSWLYRHAKDYSGTRSTAHRPALVLVMVALAALAIDGGARGGDAAASTRGAVSHVATAYHVDARHMLRRIETHTARLIRAQNIARYAHRYAITNRLASDIYSAAEKEGLDPELAFRMVKVESDFDPMATSPVGAIGLTQLMPGTAVYYDASVTAERLYDRRLNLRIGFAHLRDLIEEYDGDVHLALAAYNRGVGAVNKRLAMGLHATSAYERVILRGYSGRGILE